MENTVEVNQLFYSTFGPWIASSEDCTTARIWNRDHMEELYAVIETDVMISCLTFSPDGLWLAVGKEGCDIGPYDISSKRYVKTQSWGVSATLSTLEFYAAWPAGRYWQ